MRLKNEGAPGAVRPDGARDDHGLAAAVPRNGLYPMALVTLRYRVNYRLTKRNKTRRYVCFWI